VQRTLHKETCSFLCNADDVESGAGVDGRVLCIGAGNRQTPCLINQITRMELIDTNSVLRPPDLWPWVASCLARKSNRFTFVYRQLIFWIANRWRNWRRRRNNWTQVL